MTNIAFGDITELPLPKERQPKTQQESKLPSGNTSLFSLYVFIETLEKIESHLIENPKIESGGLLLGHAFLDLDDPEKNLQLL